MTPKDNWHFNYDLNYDRLMAIKSKCALLTIPERAAVETTLSASPELLAAAAADIVFIEGCMK